MRRETKIVVEWTPAGERFGVVYLGRMTVQRYGTRRGALALLRALRSGRRAPEYGSERLLPDLLWPARRAACATRH